MCSGIYLQSSPQPGHIIHDSVIQRACSPVQAQSPNCHIHCYNYPVTWDAAKTWDHCESSPLHYLVIVWTGCESHCEITLYKSHTGANFTGTWGALLFSPPDEQFELNSIVSLIKEFGLAVHEEKLKIPNRQFSVHIRSGSNYTFQNNVLSLFLNLIKAADVWRLLYQHQWRCQSKKSLFNWNMEVSEVRKKITQTLENILGSAQDRCSSDRSFKNELKYIQVFLDYYCIFTFMSWTQVWSKSQWI